MATASTKRVLSMSKHSQSRKGTGQLPYVLVLLLGAAIAGWAWTFLVGAAIEFGSLAVDGKGQAWLFTLAASAGAVICAILVMVLVARALRALGLTSDYKPRRAAARRRAK